MKSKMKTLKEIVDSLLAAHNRELAEKDDATRISIQTAQAIFNAELAAKDAEIERLKDDLFVYAGGHVITGAERYLKEKNRQLESRIELLQRALKPVMECDVSIAKKFSAWHKAFIAVREAQRIMKEGETK